MQDGCASLVYEWSVSSDVVYRGNFFEARLKPRCYGARALRRLLSKHRDGDCTTMQAAESEFCSLKKQPRRENQQTSLKKEEVVCFNKRIILQHFSSQPIFFDNDFLNKIWKHLLLVDRSVAERDDSLKQLVVYVLVKHRDEYLTYERTSTAMEENLRGRSSIGIGGHVNKTDESWISDFYRRSESSHHELLKRAALRELTEEIAIETRFTGPDLIFFINDDTDDVSLKHFGLVWQVLLEGSEVKPKSGSGVGWVAFHDLKYLRAHLEGFETWSKLIIKRLYESSQS